MIVDIITPIFYTIDITRYIVYDFIDSTIIMIANISATIDSSVIDKSFHRINDIIDTVMSTDYRYVGVSNNDFA